MLRKASASVNHIDTSDFYCPHATNQIIREALHSYPDDLVIATKVGARRGRDASVHPAMSREDLTQAVYDAVAVVKGFEAAARIALHDPNSGARRSLSRCE